MNSDVEKFVKEGILRYKSATNTYVSFIKEVENRLQNILTDRKDWRSLKPNFKTVKSTRYWVEYPLINSRIECNYKDQKIKLIIAINWYESDLETPFYCVRCKNINFLQNTFENANEEFDVVDDQLRYFPDVKELNLKRDFNLLIDEYLKYVDD